MNKKISVIVPVYKAQKYLDKCIESIVNQTYKNLEIILVDDGSPDNCPQICDDWAKKDSRIVVIHKQNGGVSSARNLALEKATGEFIGFVDSDDYIEPEMFEVLLNSCIEHNSDMSVCGSFYKGKRLFFDHCNTYTATEAIDIMFDGVTGAFEGYVWNKLYSKKVISDFDIMFKTDIKLCEDTWFNFDYISKIKSVTVTDYCGYNHIYLDESCSNDIGVRTDDSIIKVIEYFISQTDNNCAYKGNMLAWCAKFLLGYINNIVINNVNIKIANNASKVIKKYCIKFLKSNKITTVNKLQMIMVSICKYAYYYVVKFNYKRMR